jgi:ribosome-associated protein
VSEHGTPPGASPTPLYPAAGAGAPSPEDIRAIARACLDDMKAEDTVEIELIGKTSLADAMFITSGRSNRHVGSIAEKLVEELKQRGHGRVHIEGMPACDWVLIDAGDIIVHVFRPEVRGFYNLEKMWGADRPLDQAAS